MESVREVCLRGLVRRIWAIGGGGTRFGITRLVGGMILAGALSPPIEGDDSMELDGDEEGGEEKTKEEKEKERKEALMDEAECIAAGMIYRGFMKGYISHEKRMIVLAAKEPFPKLGSVNVK